MAKIKFKAKDYLFIITIAYFLLPMINIHLALLGFICMATPMFIIFAFKSRFWCAKCCPRSSLYSGVGKLKKNRGIKISHKILRVAKWVLFAYFCFNLGFIIYSTIMVGLGNAATTHLRLYMFIKLDFLTFPQAVTFQVAPWLTHLSYSFYSMMLSTTLLGLILGLIFKPRTWCAVCPISTLSILVIKKPKSAAAKCTNCKSCQNACNLDDNKTKQ